MVVLVLLAVALSLELHRGDCARAGNPQQPKDGCNSPTCLPCSLAPARGVIAGVLFRLASN
jgi:hypothetical protein